jgi:hypothetical protein
MILTMTYNRNRLVVLVSILFFSTNEAANLLRGNGEFRTTIPLEDNNNNNKAGTRFFARYSDWEGRRLVQKCANAIVSDDDNTDYTIFEGDSLCFDLLKASTLISSVEEDHPVMAFGESPLREWYHRQQRRMAEQLPWGIEAIQADQLEAGKHDVTICIVDSGIAADHPDFVSDKIRGMDRTDKPWEWNNDRAGHGR